jgi:pterin-4a-carbinolamine dehydratase
MKILLKNVLFVSLISTGTLLAGSSHSHGSHSHVHTKDELSKQEIKKVARMQIHNLIRLAKIDTVWKETPILSMKIEKFNHHEEWVVTYNNKTIQDKTKQTLYIFVSLHGKIKGSNYTGK